MMKKTFSNKAALVIRWYGRVGGGGEEEVEEGEVGVCQERASVEGPTGEGEWS